MEIYTINTGYIKMKSNFYLFPGLKEIRIYPVLVFLIRINNKTILYDTGLSDSLSGNIGIFDKFVTLVDTDRFSIVNQLDRLNVSPENIDVIINSHLHFDHCSGNPLFAGKPILIQQKELVSYRESRKNPMYNAISISDNQQFIEINGEHDLFGDGTARLLPAYGHSDGLQILSIEDQGHFCIFLGDTCYIKDRQLYPIEVEGMNNYPQSLATIKYINDLIVSKWDKRINLFSSHDLAFEQQVNSSPNENEVIQYSF